MLDYIGNAKIVNFEELPKIGGEHEIIKKVICVETKIIDFQDDYIIYEARFCEKESFRCLCDFFVDCCTWQYAVKKWGDYIK